MSTAPSRFPWEGRDLAGWLVTVVFGGAVWAAGYWLASDRAVLADQWSGAALSLGGAALVGAGQGTFILRGRRAVGRRAEVMLSSFETEAAGQSSSSPSTAKFVAVENRRLFHQPDCQLIVGRDATPASRAVWESAGLRACGVCQP